MFPPEKYYEACISYHLVTEFDTRFHTKMFPFAISQVAEHEKGYDFGYEVSSTSFFVQYKRPYRYRNALFEWKIDPDQLRTIVKSNGLFKTYYALPAFYDIHDWYEGIDKTYFVLAPRLYHYLEKSNQTYAPNIIRSDNRILNTWSEIARLFSHEMMSLAATPSISFHPDDLLPLDVLSESGTSSLWLYLLGGH